MNRIKDIVYYSFKQCGIETPWQKEKPEQIKQNIYNKTAIHRFASVSEIVKGYEFCIDNPFVNGSLIEINGGYSYK